MSNMDTRKLMHDFGALAQGGGSAALTHLAYTHVPEIFKLPVELSALAFFYWGGMKIIKEKYPLAHNMAFSLFLAGYGTGALMSSDIESYYKSATEVSRLHDGVPRVSQQPVRYFGGEKRLQNG